jgi:hypothetical protein
MKLIVEQTPVITLFVKFKVYTVTTVKWDKFIQNCIQFM